MGDQMRCAAQACAMNTALARLPDARNRLPRIIPQGGGIQFARGQMLLAHAFHDRIGVEAGTTEAVHWVRAAAYQRYSEGMYWLGVCYEYGDGVEQNWEHAVHWLPKAAERRWRERGNDGSGILL